MAGGGSGAGRAAAREAARPEGWTRLAWLPAAAFLLQAVYLGLRPGGELPPRVYALGLQATGVAALLGLAAALAACALRRPFLQPGRRSALLALALGVVLSSLPVSYPTSRAHRASAVAFELPVEGEWIVRAGGASWRTNALAFQPARCRGFDLVPAREDEEGAGPPVLAPCAGEVVRVHDGEPEVASPEGAPGHPFGNHVALRVAEGEHLFLTSLRAGSLRATVGQRVERGELLAVAGSSGAPPGRGGTHLGIHLQTSPEAGRGEGIPFAFRSYESGGRRVERGVPEGGLDRLGRAAGERVRALRDPVPEALPARGD